MSPQFPDVPSHGLQIQCTGRTVSIVTKLEDLLIGNSSQACNMTRELQTQDKTTDHYFGSSVAMVWSV